MKRIFSIILLVGITVSAGAQDEKAKKILSDLSAKAKTFTTIQASFTKTFVKGKINETASGSVAIKGKKYFAETGEGQNLYCDGRTVWTHVPTSNEVIKCSLEEVMKDAPFDPSQMFSIWEKDFKYRFVKEEGNLDVIDLYPLKPAEKQFHTITLKIDRTKKEITQFIVKGKDGSVSTYSLKTFVPNGEIPDSKFNFVPSKFPGIDIIDC